MRRYFLPFFTLIAHTGLFSQDYTMYIPYRSKGLWGYADTSGKVVITPAYRVEPEFFKAPGLARVFVNKEGKRMVGVINAGGKEVVSPRYPELWLFHYFIEGKVNGRFEIMNADGKIMIKAPVMATACSTRYILARHKDSVSFYRYDENTKTVRKIRSFARVKDFYFSGSGFEIQRQTAKSNEREVKFYDTLGNLTGSENFVKDFNRYVVEQVLSSSGSGNDFKMERASPGVCRHIKDVEAYRCNTAGAPVYIARKRYYYGVLDDSCRELLPFEYEAIRCFDREDCYDSYERELVFSVEKGMDRVPVIVTTAGRKTGLRYSSIEPTSQPFRYISSRNNLRGLIYVAPLHIYETPPAYKDIWQVRIMGDMVLYRITTQDGKTGFMSDRGKAYFD